jgi:hypothetical protein
MSKRNWFETLNQALESEKLIEGWPFGTNVGYGETARVYYDEGKHTRVVIVFRDTDGRYERPVHYITV